MGEISKALATPVTFQYKSQTYQLSPWNFGILGEFEVYLQDEALRNLKKMRKVLTEDEFVKLASETRKDIDKGSYTFGGPLVQEALGSFKHFGYLVFLCLRDNHPEINYPWVLELLQEEGEMVAQKMTEANSDPNRKTPAPG